MSQVDTNAAGQVEGQGEKIATSADVIEQAKELVRAFSAVQSAMTNLNQCGAQGVGAKNPEVYSDAIREAKDAIAFHEKVVANARAFAEANPGTRASLSLNMGGGQVREVSSNLVEFAHSIFQDRSLQVGIRRAIGELAGVKLTGRGRR